MVTRNPRRIVFGGDSPMRMSNTAVPVDLGLAAADMSSPSAVSAPLRFSIGDPACAPSVHPASGRDAQTDRSRSASACLPQAATVPRSPAPETRPGPAELSAEPGPPTWRRILCHALQSIRPGPETYIVPLVEEQGLCVRTGAQGSDGGHNNGVIAAVVLLV